MHVFHIRPISAPRQEYRVSRTDGVLTYQSPKCHGVKLPLLKLYTAGLTIVRSVIKKIDNKRSITHKGNRGNRSKKINTAADARRRRSIVSWVRHVRDFVIP